MSAILHILNGDSTAHSFRETGLEGDMLVWREVFSQGPLIENISSADFWKKREEWICSSFKEKPEEYQKNVVDPLDKLSEPYDEINLWFEFDLHCQANLVGVLNLLLKKTDLSLPAIYLICPDSFPGKEIFRGMGELNGEELEYLYDNIRVQLDEPDFVIAEKAWELYVRGNADEVEKWIAETHFWGNLHLLKAALEAHLGRLRFNDHGLNSVEQRLLDIYNNGNKTRQSIYRRFWDTDTIYGMGDLELDIYLANLSRRQVISLLP
ncbi:MAG: DUF1835 domain-containing protein [Bacteroidetes bacterium]|nr:DUF1835 domain-containing protein [Bacteroidota bacterium]